MSSPSPPPSPTKKRPRHNTSPSSALQSKNSELGLFALFGGGKGNRKPEIGESQQHSKQQRRCKQKDKNDHPFFTLRMEHREGGPMAQHYGEERILLFRSDQPGAVAKIIYSSTPAEDFDDDDNDHTQQQNNNNEDELERMTQAKIHVLSVKEQYRGYNLGGLLFSEAMSSLRHRYHECNEIEAKGNHDNGYLYSSSVRCQLDAEEDIRRHNKLVGFYEHLGCHVKPKAKITYINNNDGETYRKIPMQIALRSRDDAWMNSVYYEKAAAAAAKKTSSSLKTFLPITLLESPGKRVELSKHCGQRLDWLLVEVGGGDLEFRTTSGLLLLAVDDGQCQLSEDKAIDDNNSTTTTALRRDSLFHLERISDKRQVVPNTGDDDGNENDTMMLNTVFDDDGYYSPSKNKELWMVKTAYHSYLAVDPTSHYLYCSKDPIYWLADSSAFTLECTDDTPSRREHYRKMWATQTVEYNRRMRLKYLDFNVGRMTLKDALDHVKNYPANPFQVGSHGPQPSLRGLLYRTAEAARTAGHPDWVQFIALVHGLGSVLRYINPKTASDFSESEYDWTITCSTRIMGCKAPDHALFHEFRGWNADEKDSRYNTSKGIYESGCGFENVSLAWTGTEYMYFMLKRNEIDIPEDGLAILRYFSLNDWHSQNGYSTLASPDDDDIRAFVADFDELRCQAKEFHLKSIDFDDTNCDVLWDTHYSHIARKYGADGVLRW